MPASSVARSAPAAKSSAWMRFSGFEISLCLHAATATPMQLLSSSIVPYASTLGESFGTRPAP